MEVYEIQIFSCCDVLIACWCKFPEWVYYSTALTGSVCSEAEVDSAGAAHDRVKSGEVDRHEEGRGAAAFIQTSREVALFQRHGLLLYQPESLPVSFLLK